MRERLFLLVLRCQAGDEAAFSALYHEFHGRTLRYLKGILGETAADDVQQDVWLTVYRRLSELANPGGFRTWLYRVTRHRAIDALRHEGRRSELLAPPGEDFDPDLLPADDDTTDARFGGGDIDDLLARLSKAHREALILRFREELSYEDIALVTGCSVGTVRSRLHHAKANLRVMLERTSDTEQRSRP